MFRACSVAVIYNMRFASLCLLVLVLAACTSSESHPDVSNNPAEIVVRRFDKSLAMADTGNMPAMMQMLDQEFPGFFQGFMANVLGIDAANPEAERALKAFQSSYKPIFEEAGQVWQKDSAAFLQQLKLAIQLAQYYFPQNPLPRPFEVITFVGPMDAYEPFPIGDYGDVSTKDGAGLALQFYLGKHSGIYETGMESGVMYDYQVDRFEPRMMAVNTVKNMVLALFPYNANGDVLVNEMIEKGKRLYLVKLLMPNTPDSLQFGYTAKQWEGCVENESLIWNYFVKADLLYSKEPAINQMYIHDGPMTQELGEGAPGYIGLFVGRRIVEAYMEKHPNTKAETLMAIPASKMLQEAGYKPV